MTNPFDISRLTPPGYTESPCIKWEILDMIRDVYIETDNRPTKTFIAYLETHKGQWRLKIMAHGNRQRPGKALEFPNDNGYIEVNGIKTWLLEHFDMDKPYCIQLEACHSAYGGNVSLAAHLSRLFPNKYVKGYAGKIYYATSAEHNETRAFPDTIVDRLRLHGANATYTYAVNYLNMHGRQMFLKTQYPYQSVTYLNGVCVKNRCSTVQDNGNEYITL